MKKVMLLTLIVAVLAAAVFVAGPAQAKSKKVDICHRTRDATGIFKDEFSFVSFSNNDGNLDWENAWIEDDAAGAGPGSGNVQIIGGELHLTDYPDTGTQPSAARQANLSGARSAVLTFDWRTSAGVDADDSIIVEVSQNGGAAFTILEDFTGIIGSNSGSRGYDISAFASAETMIRFRDNNKYGGRDEFFFVDNVQITLPGGYKLINISVNAEKAHLKHGDAHPGDPVPNLSGIVFDDSCTPVPAA